MTTATNDEMSFEKSIWEAFMMTETMYFHTTKIVVVF